MTEKFNATDLQTDNQQPTTDNNRQRASRLPHLTAFLFLLLAFCLLPSAFCLPSPAPAPSPTPPPWQAEIDTARGLQASLALVPAKEEKEEQERHARMVEIYRRLAAKHPDVAPVQQAAGEGLAGLDQRDAALQLLQRAQTLEPKNAETADTIGSIYLATNRVRVAAAQFQRAVDAQPDVARHHFALANVQYLFRHQLVAPPALPDDQAVLRQALEHFRRAAELAPGDLRLAKAYAETFYVFAQPDWAQALAAWQMVLALSGEDQDFANSHLARISLRLGRRGDAEAYLSKIHSPAFDGMKKKMRQQTNSPAKVTPSSGPKASPRP